MISNEETRKGRVRLVCLAAAAAGALALAVALATAPAFPMASLWAALACTFALAATHVVPLHLPHAGDSEALHVDEVLFVPMVLLLAPVQTMASFSIALIIASLVSRRGIMKALFNVGMLLFSGSPGIDVGRFRC